MSAAAVLVAELAAGEPATEDAAPEPCGANLAAAAVRTREFAAAGEDLEAFKRHFSANCTLAGWTEAKALKALPTTLDDDALAAFYAIPPGERTTLFQVFAQMAAVYDLLSSVRHKFIARRRGEAETPLAFRSALLSLAQAAFPKMEPAGVDSLVLEWLMVLVHQKRMSRPRPAPRSTAEVGGGAMKRGEVDAIILAGTFPLPGNSPIIFYNSGLPGHVSTGCRTEVDGILDAVNFKEP
ncbi:unnamed protein product [Lampetra planeri]